ncbi:MAG: hypothetical protein ACYC2H_10130 [Thermoplasmatota archaeon]
MTHRLAHAELAVALPILRTGGGWVTAVAAVNAARPGAPPASRRTIRRAMKALGLLEAFPRAGRDPAVAGGRPRKPGITDAEFKLAIGVLAARGPGSQRAALAAAAAAISRGAAAAAARLDPAGPRGAKLEPVAVGGGAVSVAEQLWGRPA